MPNTIKTLDNYNVLKFALQCSPVNNNIFYDFLQHKIKNTNSSLCKKDININSEIGWIKRIYAFMVSFDFNQKKYIEKMDEEVSIFNTNAIFNLNLADLSYIFGIPYKQLEKYKDIKNFLSFTRERERERERAIKLFRFS